MQNGCRRCNRATSADQAKQVAFDDVLGLLRGKSVAYGLVGKPERDNVEAEPSLKDLQERLRKLQTEKADLLLQAKKLEKTARKRVRSLKEEIKALRKKVKYFRELSSS